MNTILTIFVFAFFILTLCSVAASFYLYGMSVITRKVLIQFRRDQKRLARERNLWQDVSMRKLGLGSLKPPKETKKPESDDERVVPKVVSASQAIALEKAEKAKAPKINAQIVPQAIKEGFIKEAGEIVR